MSVFDPINDESPAALGEHPEMASPARVYDYLLGGSHNFAIDREVGKRLEEQMPGAAAAVRANRHFLHRAVRFLITERGVTQFLDLGSGIPTAGNVHEIGQALHSGVRVVYVDVDPVAVAHAVRILADDWRTTAIRADIREPAAILDDPRVTSTLDLTKPVAVLAIAVFHFVQDDPGTILATYLSRLASGSFLALSHADSDPDPAVQAASDLDYYRSTGVRIATRGPAQIGSWLDELVIEEPGIVPVTEWRPDGGLLLSAADIKPVYGAVARKP